MENRQRIVPAVLCQVDGNTAPLTVRIIQFFLQYLLRILVRLEYNYLEPARISLSLESETGDHYQQVCCKQCDQNNQQIPAWLHHRKSPLNIDVFRPKSVQSTESVQSDRISGWIGN